MAQVKINSSYIVNDLRKAIQHFQEQTVSLKNKRKRLKRKWTVYAAHNSSWWMKINLLKTKVTPEDIIYKYTETTFGLNFFNPPFHVRKRLNQIEAQSDAYGDILSGMKRIVKACDIVDDQPRDERYIIINQDEIDILTQLHEKGYLHKNVLPTLLNS